MTSYLLKILAVLWVSNFVVYLYYFVANGHKNSYAWFMVFFIVTIVLYLLYKISVRVFSRDHQTLRISFWSLIGLFLFQLFVTCCLFFQFNWLWFQNGLLLFLTVLMYALLPIATFLASYGTWDTFLQKLKHHADQSQIFQFLSALWLGFFLFVSALTLLWMLQVYNIYTTLGLLLSMLWVWFFSLKKLWSLVWNIELTFENAPNKPSILYLLSTEFLFLILSFVISVNLISIVRPVPIGWDDLGVYMNYAHLIAQSGDILSLGWMYSWQVFTSMGFVVSWNTQAFFLNSIWGMMSILVAYLMLRDIFAEWKKTFLNIPLLLSTLLLSMPMMIFQLSKDMKLDPWLLFVSSIALFIVYYVFTRLDKSSVKISYVYVFIAALLVWFAFTIKVTSLLLLSGILWLVCFRYLWILWFLWYLSLYFAIFNGLGLWWYLNINLGLENILLMHTLTFISALFGALALLPWFFWGSKRFQDCLKYVWIIICWFVLAVSPWLLKNALEARGDMNIGTLIWGKANNFKPDFTLIHSEEELIKIREENERSMSASGTIQNEDWGRYFWYEKGINNYIKLPLNLTVQKNQSWEFTDIWFIYLAFLPTILLFLPYRRKNYVYITLGVCVLGFLSLFFPPTAHIMTWLMSQVTLPSWYLIILWVFLSWLILWSIVDTKKRFMKLFVYNLVFAITYVFLWTISAYGVVWYGIMMYVNFLIMIGISLYYASSYKSSDSEKEITLKLFWSGILFLICTISFLLSTLPQALNNLKNTWSIEYKLWITSAHEYLFDNQVWYLEAIFALNIEKEKHKEFYEDVFWDSKLKQTFLKTIPTDILQVRNSLKLMSEDERYEISIQNDAAETQKKLYEKILHPDALYENTGKVYRIGTFLSYYIVQNKKRLYNDSLLFNFDDYIYDSDSSKSLGNLKKLWLEYLLVDLNAATIDKDGRRNLTKRYEKMLSLFKEDNLKLVSTDSTCLKLALHNYKRSWKTEKDIQEFMYIGWVNYVSYDASDKKIEKNKKLLGCYLTIDKLVQKDENTLLTEGYTFILPIKRYLDKQTEWSLAKDEQARISLLAKIVPTGRFSLFTIK